ncbi:MAG: hypothetical protein RSE00_02700 [Clostridia bacterium]
MNCDAKVRENVEIGNRFWFYVPDFEEFFCLKAYLGRDDKENKLDISLERDTRHTIPFAFYLKAIIEKAYFEVFPNIGFEIEKLEKNSEKKSNVYSLEVYAGKRCNEVFSNDAVFVAVGNGSFWIDAKRFKKYSHIKEPYVGNEGYNFKKYILSNEILKRYNIGSTQCRFLETADVESILKILDMENEDSIRLENALKKHLNKKSHKYNNETFKSFFKEDFELQGSYLPHCDYFKNAAKIAYTQYKLLLDAISKIEY